MSDLGLSDKIDALGRFLLATHAHEARPDSERSWLLRRKASRPACRELRAAFGLDPAPVPTERLA
jgi:hypothetical protein